MSGSSSSLLAERPSMLDRPLAMTVHSLPVPQEALARDAQRTARGRLRMLAVLLVCAAGGACDARCERHLYLQRQLRESLGQDRERIDWVWLVADGAAVREP